MKFYILLDSDIEIIFLIRIVGQIIQLLNKENNYGLIIIRISNVLGNTVDCISLYKIPIHEMNRVKINIGIIIQYIL